MIPESKYLQTPDARSGPNPGICGFGPDLLTHRYPKNPPFISPFLPYGTSTLVPSCLLLASCFLNEFLSLLTL